MALGDVAGAFRPNFGYAIKNIAVGAGNTTTDLTRTTENGVKPYSAVRLANVGTDVVSVKFGVSGVTAATTDMKLLPNSVEVFNINPDVTHIATIGVAGGNTLQVMEGDGV